MFVSRTSTRLVKRKKFDDEIVESSFKKDKFKKALNSINSNKISPSTTTDEPGIVSATISPSQPLCEEDKNILFSEESNETIEHNETIIPNEIGERKSDEFEEIGEELVEQLASDHDTNQFDINVHKTKEEEILYHESPEKPTIVEDKLQNNERIIETCVSNNFKADPIEKPNQLKTKISTTKSNKIKSFKESIDCFLQESWLPDDDLNLILSIQQACDLNVVHLCTHFSRPYTLKEITKRWNQLLFDTEVSRSSMQSIKNLHVDTISYIESKLPFSKSEENVIATISSTSQAAQDIFEELLVANPTVFNSNRTSKSLYKHWSLLKLNYLLPDQTVQPIQKSDHILIFSDAEEQLNDDVINEYENDPELEKEMTLADRRNKREIRQLEQEVTMWQAVVESIPGGSNSEFDNLTLATLRGRHVKYYMRSNKISFGRGCKDNLVDVDLTLAGPAFKISRQQGWINYHPPQDRKDATQPGHFILANEGRCPMYINGGACLKGQKVVLYDNSVIEVSCIKLIFYINKELLNYMRSVNE